MKRKKILGICICLSCILVGGFSGVYASGDYEMNSWIEKQCKDITKHMNKKIDNLDYNVELSSLKEDVFIDEKNTVYCVDGNEIVSFMKEEIKEKNTDNKKNEKQLRSIADACMKEMADGRKYKFDSMELNEDTDLYYFRYCKYVGKYKTADKIYIFLDENGNISSAGNPNKGDFDDVVIKKSINEKEMQAFVKAKFEEMEKSGAIFTIEDVRIEKVDGKTKLAMFIHYHMPLETMVNTEKMYIDMD